MSETTTPGAEDQPTTESAAATAAPAAAQADVPPTTAFAPPAWTPTPKEPRLIKLWHGVAVGAACLIVGIGIGGVFGGIFGFLAGNASHQDGWDGPRGGHGMVREFNGGDGFPMPGGGQMMPGMGGQQFGGPQGGSVFLGPDGQPLNIQPAPNQKPAQPK